MRGQHAADDVALHPAALAVDDAHAEDAARAALVAREATAGNERPPES